MARTNRRLGRLARALAFGLAAAAAAPVAGCRVSDDDIHRWESTAHGPEKLRAVLFHEKYEIPLRVEAAMSLIRMKPRQGRRIGIEEMVRTLGQVPPDSRQLIVASLVPRIIDNLKEKPPAPPPGQVAIDPTFPFKDAAYAMLTAEQPIVADEGLKQSLKTALVEWAMADFEPRLANQKQTYSMEQLLRHLGSPGVGDLPKLMTRQTRVLDQLASLAAELGDEKTKEEASAAVVAIAKYVASDEWVKEKKPELEAANAASKLSPTPEQFKAQLQTYQDEELVRVFGSMKKVGGRPAVDFALAFAADKNQSEKRRQAALAAVEGKLSPKDIDKVAAIAISDAPDVVLDQAFRRLGEMPREAVVAKLYEIFAKSDKWKVRRAAAGTALRMSRVEHVDEFMSKLPEGKAQGFAMPEAIAYGASIGDLKGDKKPVEALRKYFKEGSPAQRTTALAYWLTHGTSADLAEVKAFSGDKAPAPSCDAEDACKWVCEIQKEGSKDPKERELKDVKTVGDFVRYCVVPAMELRKPSDKADPNAKPEEKK